MPLTVSQIADVRLVVGDLHLQESGNYILSDDVISDLYDTTESFLKTYIKCLRRIVGWYAVKIRLSNITGTTEDYNQLYEHYKDLLEYYEEQLLKAAGEIVTDDNHTIESGLDFVSLALNEPDAN